MSASTLSLSANYLLAALPPEEYDAIAARCRVVRFDLRAPLHDAGEPYDVVYFPLSGLCSVTTLMADGAMVEVGTIGREGTTALPALFGAASSPLRTFCQIPGVFARLPIAAFREVAAPGTALHTGLLRYAQAYYILAAQSSGCNRLHPMEERCARWILLTHDRVGADTFPLTHEFLGYMLGMRRPSVTIALNTLQAAGLLTYRRGVVTVTDRPGLEAASCECYAIIRDAFDALPTPRDDGR